MDFLPVDGRLGAGLEQIGFDQACPEKARDIVQHEADIGRTGHREGFGVGGQTFMSMLIIIMHIIRLDAERKTD
jgi:hypothetical protein